MKKVCDLVFENTNLFKDYFLNDEKSPITYFPKFSTINIIIGSNNSGKSRFLRNLMEVENLKGLNELLKIKDEIHVYNNQVDLINKDINSLVAAYNKKRNAGYRSIREDEDTRIAKNNILKTVSIDNYKDIRNVLNANLEKIQILKNKIASSFLLNDIVFDDSFVNDYSKCKQIYIPTLRTAHSLFQLNSENKVEETSSNNFKKLEDDVYLHTYLKNYKINKDVEIFTGLHLYREILNARNSKRETRNKFEKFQDFIGENFFDGRKIDIVAEFKKEYNLDGKNDNEIISIDIEGEVESRDLCDLGDGIQALIILMYKIFMASDNSLIYIDEPELNLHPGMQRLFLEQITTNRVLEEKNLNYIITTHSNHFLDLTIEKENVSIYSFSSKSNELNDKQFTIKNVNMGDNSLLKELGVNNSSVFMANSSIWVEGISDRNYIKAFLKSYCDSIGKSYPKEDIDFAFFEYAGSNIDHYIFENYVEKEDVEIVLKDIKALAISNKIFLLADSDASKKNTKKGIRLKQLEDAKTDNFIPKIVWNIREIENLLTNEIWQEILIELCNKILVKSNKIDVLAKIDEALTEINCSDFEKKYVGEFLEKVRNKMGKISSSFILNRSTYEVKSDGSFGTIINKRELSELVFNTNFSWEILSKNKEIEKLTIEIYNFITQK